MYVYIKQHENNNKNQERESTCSAGITARAGASSVFVGGLEREITFKLMLALQWWHSLVFKSHRANMTRIKHQKLLQRTSHRKFENSLQQFDVPYSHTFGAAPHRIFFFSHTPFFSHTINISNDLTLILDIIGRRIRINMKYSTFLCFLKMFLIVFF